MKTYLVVELAEGNAEYYECRAGRAKLLRERQYPGARWQLVS